MFQYGFELEGFFIDKKDESKIIPTPKGFRVDLLDGFPGLCELRTKGGDTLEGAAAQMYAAELRMNHEYVTFFKHEHKFSGEDMSYLRKNFSFEKEQLEVLNVYGKKPRALNGRTLASFQINISNLLSAEQKHTYVNKDGQERSYTTPAAYGLLDVAGIVRRLDKEFAGDIKLSGRQFGMYAIKDNYRLEYRSLPNSTWSFNRGCVRIVLNKIKKAVEGE
jgi:hypothetical protein